MHSRKAMLAVRNVRCVDAYILIKKRVNIQTATLGLVLVRFKQRLFKKIKFDISDLDPEKTKLIDIAFLILKHKWLQTRKLTP